MQHESPSCESYHGRYGYIVYALTIRPPGHPMTDTFNYMTRISLPLLRTREWHAICAIFSKKWTVWDGISCMWKQASRQDSEGDDFACSGFTRSTSAVLSLGGISEAPSLPSLSNPQHQPSPCLNHSDPAHLEPMCFSILSSTVVISNQPMSISLYTNSPVYSVISSQSEGCVLSITVPAFFSHRKRLMCFIEGTYLFWSPLTHCSIYVTKKTVKTLFKW